jgi:hypothetical protein
MNGLKVVFMHESGSNFVGNSSDFDILLTKQAKQIFFLKYVSIFVEILKAVFFI